MQVEIAKAYTILANKYRANNACNPSEGKPYFQPWIGWRRSDLALPKLQTKGCIKNSIPCLPKNLLSFNLLMKSHIVGRLNALDEKNALNTSRPLFYKLWSKA